MQTLKQRRALARKQFPAAEAERSDRESMARMHWLVQVMVMALLLPVLVFAGIVIADGLTGMGVVAELLAWGRS